jgi:hypothetical protein
MVKRTERGWAGHFICAPDCMFRRNTLLENGEERIVVSTVGAYRSKGKIETIGASGRYYETMAFKAKYKEPYFEIDVSEELSFNSEWAICAESPEQLPDDVDNLADQQHEMVVEELTEVLVHNVKLNGERSESD